MRSSTNEFQKDFWEKVGQRIINRRKQLGMTRDQLSDFLQITYKGLSQIERGEHGCSVARLIQISNILNLSLDDLLFGKHELSEHELEQIALREAVSTYCLKIVLKHSLTAFTTFCSQSYRICP